MKSLTPASLLHVSQNTLYNIARLPKFSREPHPTTSISLIHSGSAMSPLCVCVCTGLLHWEGKRLRLIILKLYFKYSLKQIVFGVTQQKYKESILGPPLNLFCLFCNINAYQGLNDACTKQSIKIIQSQLQCIKLLIVLLTQMQ